MSTGIQLSLFGEEKSPRFFYGRVEREDEQGKTGYQLCLVDLKKALFAWFEWPTQLADAINLLISPVPAEREEYDLVFLPGKNITREVPRDDQEDVLGITDELAEREGGKVVYYPRCFEEVEPADKYFGPFFAEEDFTSELDEVPEDIRQMYKFLDIRTMEAQLKVAIGDLEIVREEVEIVFHPERAEIIRRAHGLIGLTNTESVDRDLTLCY